MGIGLSAEDRRILAEIFAARVRALHGEEDEGEASKPEQEAGHA